MNPVQPGVLFEELLDAKFDFYDMDAAYQDGIDDLGTKLIELIQQSDFTVTHEDIIEFIEAEMEGPEGEQPTLQSLRVKDPQAFLDGQEYHFDARPQETQ